MRLRASKAAWLVAISLGVAVAPAGAASYNVDAAHTSVSFKIRHLFTEVEGRFTDFSGTIEFDAADPSKTRVTGEIKTASINTNNEKRDKHLRTDEFFHVEKYPTIAFVSTRVSDVEVRTKKGKLHGKLTMHGVEKPVVLDVAYLGAGADPWGNQKAGFKATTTIDRKDFGLNWNEALEAGGFLVGDEVEIQINVEAAVK